MTGRLLAGPAPAGELAIPAVVGGLAALAVVLVPRGGCRSCWPAARCSPALLIQGAPRPALAVLPWLAVVGAHVHFSAQRPSSVGRLADRVGRLLRSVTVPAARLVVGRTTWALTARPAGPGERRGAVPVRGRRPPAAAGRRAPATR
ncbi:hypothetical protein [Micromonospora sp. AMSO31t]|uniref:hypothetical protein n=1 Tax=Micromonospora sp. AMSO31t TaxID=2650566 RepID=UPI00124B534B|nr:hypothetical protein [Micromonospora sp. AMSO31t]KAB1912114.1 hypothetical protein F8274_15095 [Micromonospora sp. AMSO31t]